MRPAENIEKLIKNINIETNATTDEAVLSDMVKAFEKSEKLTLGEVKGKESANAQPSIWRTIIKSNITKLATVAVIIIVVMVGLYHYTGSFHGTTAAFATSDVITAMKQVQWIHATQQIIGNNNVPVDKLEYWNSREFWQSIDPYRIVSIGLSGDIEVIELNSKKVYDPKNNTITITFPRYPEKDQPASMQEIWLDCVSGLEKSGAKVEYSDSVYGDRPAKIIKLDYTKESGWQEKITIIVDAETHLARKIMVYQKTTTSVSGTILMLIDYPSTGPKDIYEAGAPHDAEVKVINNFIEGK
ncbi:MAG: hypothetical protein A2167_07225 [Planctomycetes bacterium RBG_13_46_10]|nr:MAG: hypothetical protein A2167_07225 [Planctomycetes bacterium RBG_13_46_10]